LAIFGYLRFKRIDERVHILSTVVGFDVGSRSRSFDYPAECVINVAFGDPAHSPLGMGDSLEGLAAFAVAVFFV
jgi:hypothetical protein